MARRTLSHKALRADFDAAERRKTEGAGGAESAVEAEAAPKKKKAPSKAPRPKRVRATKAVRQRVVWGVFNNSNARVETFPFPQKKEAEDYAARMKAEKNSTYFVQPVKEPIEDDHEG
jgi:hypothetical protein